MFSSTRVLSRYANFNTKIRIKGCTLLHCTRLGRISFPPPSHVTLRRVRANKDPNALPLQVKMLRRAVYSTGLPHLGYICPRDAFALSKSRCRYPMAVPGSQARVTPTPNERLEGQRCFAAHCDFMSRRRFVVGRFQIWRLSRRSMRSGEIAFAKPLFCSTGLLFLQGSPLAPRTARRRLF